MMTFEMNAALSFSPSRMIMRSPGTGFGLTPGPVAGTL